MDLAEDPPECPLVAVDGKMELDRIAEHEAYPVQSIEVGGHVAAFGKEAPPLLVEVVEGVLGGHKQHPLVEVELDDLAENSIPFGEQLVISSVARSLHAAPLVNKALQPRAEPFLVSLQLPAPPRVVADAPEVLRDGQQAVEEGALRGLVHVAFDVGMFPPV